MPAKEATVRQHISGKKFLRLAKEWKKPDEAQSTNRWLEKKKYKKREKIDFQKFFGDSYKTWKYALLQINRKICEKWRNSYSTSYRGQKI